MFALSKPLILISLLFLVACVQPDDAVQSDLLIVGALVVDLQKGEISRPLDLLIDSGEIIAIEESGEISSAAAIDVLDASGLFLIPGLIDVHAHIGDGGIAENTDADRELAMEQFVRYGVTSIFVPGGGGGNDEQLKDWKDRCRRDELICPRVFGSGDIITAFGSHPVTTIWDLPADTDPDVIHARGVTAIREHDPVGPIIERKFSDGAEAIKIVVEDGPGAFSPKPRLSREKIAEIVASAHARGLRVFAHVSLASHVDDVIAVGADGIMHSADDRISDKTLAKMADRGAFYVATLSLVDALLDQERGNQAQEEFAQRGVSGKALRSLQVEDYWGVAREGEDALNEWQNVVNDNLRRARDLGVKIALGTDTNNPQIFPGYAVHEELALMVDAGLSEREALESATITAAEFLRKQDEIGRLEVDFGADIVALRRNPLAEIRNTRTIEFVIRHGIRVGGVVSDP
jgi:imidazolonepropionase-like amidohydrolase